MFIRTAILFVLSCNVASAEVIVNMLAENQPWSDSRVTGGGTQLYDSRSIQFNNTAGLRLTELSFDVTVTGTFDDTIAVDLDGDSVIDWAITQDDWYAVVASRSDYRPWVDTTPFSFTATVTNTGTSITSMWNGVVGTPGIGGGVGGVGGWDNASSMTLADLGFNPDGSIPSDSFTTNEIRVGNLNQVGPSGHGSTFTFPVSGIRFTAVPEPGALGSLLVLGVAGLLRRRKWSPR